MMNTKLALRLFLVAGALALTLLGCGGGGGGAASPTSTTTASTPTTTPTTGGCTATTAPWRPSVVFAYSDSGSATVYFNPPAYDGGSAITSYTVTSTGGQTASGTASPITVTGLTNGTTYLFTVKATNCFGTSTASTAGGYVMPGAAAGAPTNVSAVAGNTQATVNYSPPASNGSYEITAYYAISSPGNIIGFQNVYANNPPSPIVVSGLTNGVAYSFTVFAYTGAGAGLPSVQTNAVTPVAVSYPPTNVTAKAGNGEATVSFVAPLNTGGSAITGYAVTSNPGNVVVNVGAAATSASVFGLTNGTPYTFTVTATNGAGVSMPSMASTSVIPATGTMLYVDAAKGSDANQGTAAAPFLSITKALAAASAVAGATTINVAPGNYTAVGCTVSCGTNAEVFPLKMINNVTLVGDVSTRGDNFSTPTRISDLSGLAAAYSFAAGSIQTGSTGKAPVVIPSGVTGVVIKGFRLEASTPSGAATGDGYEIIIDKATATLDSNYTYSVPTTSNAFGVANVIILNASNVMLTNNSFDDHLGQAQLYILDSATVVARNNIFNYSNLSADNVKIGNGMGTSACTVDFGTAASPGNNSINSGQTVTGINIVNVNKLVNASGNTWVPNTQGASATGTYTVGSAVTTATPLQWYSNYAISTSSAGIQF